MRNTKVRGAAVARSGLMILIAAVAGCSGPRVIESHSYGRGAKLPADAGATYYLPMQLIALQVERKSTPEGGALDVLTVRLQPPIPDTRRRFAVRMPHQKEYTLQTTEDGLLTSTSPLANLEGRELGQFVVTTAPVSKSRGAVDEVPASPVSAPHSLIRTVVFDPASVEDIARAEADLATTGAHYRFALNRVDAPGPRVLTASLDRVAPAVHFVDAAVEADQVYAGLVYRRPEPFMFSISMVLDGSPDVPELVSAIELSLPNVAPLEQIALPELAITTHEGLAFQRGVLAARTDSPPPKHHRFQISFSSHDDSSGSLGGTSGLPGLPVTIHAEAKSEPAVVKVKDGAGEGGQR